MKKARKYVLFLLTAAMLFSLCGCQKTGQYTDTLTAQELAHEVQSRIDEDDFIPLESDYFSDYFPSPAGVREQAARIAADGNDLDEFGIWHMETGKTDTIRANLERYLDDSLAQNQSFYSSYIPEELPKLRDAEVRVIGNYVAYAVLDREDRAQFFRVLEELLRDRA